MRSGNRSLCFQESSPPSRAIGTGGVFLCPEGQRRVIILGVVLIVLGYLLLIPVLITIGWILAGIGLVLLLIAVIGHREIGGRRYWF